jgi:hypothetical protein
MINTDPKIRNALNCVFVPLWHNLFLAVENLKPFLYIISLSLD